MSEYTPELDVIRERAIRGGRALALASGEPPASAHFYGADFDRWLAQHEAAIRRDQIIRDGHIACTYGHGADTNMNALAHRIEDAIRAQSTDPAPEVTVEDVARFEVTERKEQ